MVEHEGLRTEIEELKTLLSVNSAFRLDPRQWIAPLADLLAVAFVNNRIDPFGAGSLQGALVRDGSVLNESRWGNLIRAGQAQFFAAPKLRNVVLEQEEW